MIDYMFRNHPRSVGETYFEHMHTATSFGSAMMLAGLACFIHGFLPNIFKTTGSDTVKKLHNRMVVNRSRVRPQSSDASAAPQTR
ncbi:DUF6356 family protein [Sphingobium sp.]|uniref:DUF6356 family protein n=1 Tax=Sphingobium sp. TaxID=1912891 RepID=UPI0026046E68|nr:DUF6356 family protein [Sphingobium sp.]